MATCTGPGPRQRGRPVSVAPAERRERVIAAAETLFLGQGYAATRMSDVAVEAAMSKRTLYEVFATKTALFDAVADRVLREAPDLVPARCPRLGGRALLHATLLQLSECALSERRLALSRTVFSDTELAGSWGCRLIAANNALWHSVLCDVFRRSGIAPPVQCHDKLALMVSDALIGSRVLPIVLGLEAPPSPETLRHRVDLLVDLLH